MVQCTTALRPAVRAPSNLRSCGPEPRAEKRKGGLRPQPPPNPRLCLVLAELDRGATRHTHRGQDVSGHDPPPKLEHGAHTPDIAKLAIPELGQHDPRLRLTDRDFMRVFKLDSTEPIEIWFVHF